MTISRLLIAMSASAAALHGQYCELEIRAESQIGQPVSAIAVVRTSHGSEFARLENGLGKFCDVGFNMFSVELSQGDNCPRVRVENLRQHWLRPLKLRVALPDCLDEPMLKPSSCVVIVRGRDRDGRVPRGLKFSGVPGTDSPQFGDKYGRIVFHLEYGKEAVLEVAAEKVSPLRHLITCTMKEPELDVTVWLQETATGERE